jgi:phosphoglycolate phosphatase
MYLKILFWDIDGTLMRTDRAGLFAFEQAVSESLAACFDFTGITTAGMTDCHIAAQIISIVKGRNPHPEEITALINRYEQVLPAHLAARQGSLMPSVPAILEYMHRHDDYLSLLLTGNTIAGARAKLTRYGIIDYFNFDLSAFADHCPDRLQLADNALAKVRSRWPDITTDSIYIIGDTPNDIRCGKHINARTIAVATGGYSFEELQKHTPWWCVQQLPAPEEFEKKLV